MPRRDFVSIPNVPETGNPAFNKFLDALKQNVELLAALRSGQNNHAVVKGDIETAYPNSEGDLDDLRETVRKLMVDLKE